MKIVVEPVSVYGIGTSVQFLRWDGLCGFILLYLNLLASNRRNLIPPVFLSLDIFC